MFSPRHWDHQGIYSLLTTFVELTSLCKVCLNFIVRLRAQISHDLDLFLHVTDAAIDDTTVNWILPECRAS